MANAANSPFVKHPALLALFAPRPSPPFKAPMPSKSMPKLSGIAQFTQEFTNSADLTPPKKYETPTERKERIKTEKTERHHQLLIEREKQWDPHNNPNATKDPYKTLFVARLSYNLTEDDLRREFERYGRIRDVKLITDKKTEKSRGYAFIEFERSNDLKEAFQHADGHKLKGRRILVDVERGRTVKTWKPRKLGGGLGKTRAGPNTDKHKNAMSPSNGSNRHPTRSPHKAGNRDRNRGKKDGKYSNRRDKYRDRDYRDRDRRSGRKEDRGRERKRSRSRSRDRKDRSKRRDKKDVKERDGRRDRRDGGYEVKYEKGERSNGRKERDNKDRDRARRRGGRVKEEPRRR